MKQKSSLIIILFITTFQLFLPQCSKTGSNINSQSGMKFRLSINKLNSQGIDDKIVSDITFNLYKNLKKLKGAERVLFREIDGVDKSANRQLTGSFSKLGKSYVLTIKVVEGEKGHVLFDKTLMLKNIDDINDKIEDIAKEISKNKSIW